MKKCFISRLTTCCTFIRHTANKDYDVKVAQYASARICRLTSVFSDFSSFACLYLTVENNLMIIPGNTDWLQWTLWDLWKLLASWYNLNYHLKPDIRETFNNERGETFPPGFHFFLGRKQVFVSSDWSWHKVQGMYSHVRIFASEISVLSVVTCNVIWHCSYLFSVWWRHNFFFVIWTACMV